MLIQYKFSIDGYSVSPIYSDDLSKEYELEPQQRFFRTKLSGKLSFRGWDYDFIFAKTMDDKMELLVEKSINSGATWYDYIETTFTKADCKWNPDNKNVDVSLDIKDDYTEVMAGLNKEYNLIKLAPQLESVDYYKRPLIQIYTPGDGVVSCFLMGNYWEQDVSFEVSGVSDLINVYHFAEAGSRKFISVTGTGTPSNVLGEYARETRDVYRDVLNNYRIHQIKYSNWTVTDSNHGKEVDDIGTLYIDLNDNLWFLESYDNDHITFSSYFHDETNPQLMPPSSGELNGYGVLVYYGTTTGNSGNTNTIYYDAEYPNGYTFRVYLIRNSDGYVVFKSALLTSKHESGDIVLVGQSQGGGAGTVTADYYETGIYARALTENTEATGLGTPSALPLDDIVEDNRNYNYAIGYDVLEISDAALTQVEPTEYGRSDNGDYFIEPDTDKRYYPIARSTWRESSLWYSFTANDNTYDIALRKLFTFKNVYLLNDVIQVLLNQINTNLYHLPQSASSEFLYSDPNPVLPDVFRLLLTQKSNVLAGEYDKPAQKAPITLGGILTMLREVFQCYWHIDSFSFKIEHISWYKNGGSYSGTPSYTADLTVLEDVRNNKKIGFAQNAYDFDVANLSQQLQFSWMDDVTEGFEGEHIKILSNYVRDGKVDTINAGQYTTDIDYMLLNPNAINQDGFALFGADINDTNLYTGGASYDERLNVLNGATILGTGWRLTPFMSIKDGEFYTRLYGGDICWYGGGGFNFISGETSTTILTRKAPIGALTCRCAVQIAYFGGWKFVKGMTLAGTFQLPFVEITHNNATLKMQNGFLSWLYLHPNAWTYDLPGKKIVINNIESPQLYADGIMRTKKQIVKYPSTTDPDPMKLIKTDLGDGQIRKISVNLSSGMNEIELRYDTE